MHNCSISFACLGSSWPATTDSANCDSTHFDLRFLNFGTVQGETIFKRANRSTPLTLRSGHARCHNRASKSTADPAGAHICCVCSVQLRGSVGQLCSLCEHGINSVPPFSSLKASMQTLNWTPSTAASDHLAGANW